MLLIYRGEILKPIPVDQPYRQLRALNRPFQTSSQINDDNCLSAPIYLESRVLNWRYRVNKASEQNKRNMLLGKQSRI